MAFSLQPRLVGSLLLPSWTHPGPYSFAYKERPEEQASLQTGAPCEGSYLESRSSLQTGVREQRLQTEGGGEARRPASASRVGRKQRWSEEENREASGLWPKRGSASLLSKSAKKERKHREPHRPQPPQGPTDEARWGPSGLGCRTGHL